MNILRDVRVVGCEDGIDEVVYKQIFKNRLREKTKVFTFRVDFGPALFSRYSRTSSALLQTFITG